MSIALEAVFDVAAVTKLLTQLTPLTIDLGDERHSNRTIEVARPQLVELVAGTGLRVRTSARVQWKLGLLNVPVTISSATVLLRLAISPAPYRLQLLPHIEDADLKNVPAVVDRTLVDKINQRLAQLAIGWDFGKTLALRLALPPALKAATSDPDTTSDTAMRFEMDAATPTLEITQDRVRIGLHLLMQIAR